MTRTTPQELLVLPQSTETWYLAVRKLRIWITPEDKPPRRPYLTIAFRAPTGEILGSTLVEQPDPNQVLLKSSTWVTSWKRSHMPRIT